MDRPVTVTSSLPEEQWETDSPKAERPAAPNRVARIADRVADRHLVLISGLRGTGKSTLMHKAAFRLPRQGMDRDRILTLDLEDPLMAPGPTTDQLDSLMGSRGRPRPRAIFLSGLSRIPESIEWIRKTHSRFGAGIAASIHGPIHGPGGSVGGPTGVPVDSPAALPTRTPTGLEVIPCLPMDFSRWQDKFTDTTVGLKNPREKLEAYLRAGGLLLPRPADRRSRALTDLFHAILFKDILLRQPVRDPNVLTAVAVNLVSNTGRPVSAGKLKGRLTRSTDQARMFLNHLEQSGLIYLVPRLKDAARPAAQASRLCFAADTGLAWALTRGRVSIPDLMLTAVFLELLRRGDRVWAWRRRGRIGLAAGHPDRPDLLADVQYHPDSDSAAAVDLKPLTVAMAKTGCPEGLVLTAGGSARVHPAKQGIIHVLPAWEWLAPESNRQPESDGLAQSPAGGPTDTPVNTETSRDELPRHLL